MAPSSWICYSTMGTLFKLVFVDNSSSITIDYTFAKQQISGLYKVVLLFLAGNLPTKHQASKIKGVPNKDFVPSCHSGRGFTRMHIKVLYNTCDAARLGPASP
jgi:hypothetical protein